MTVVAAGGLVARAAAGARAVLAFNVVTLEHAEAVIAGAEATGSPVILAVSHNTIRFHGRLSPLAAACRSLAEGATVPVGLHLDHIEDIALIREGAEAGFGSVMFDASRLDHEANVAETARASSIANAAGVWLESELGEIGGKDGLHAPTARTDPPAAADFVRRTGVDALAVAVGTSHAMTSQDADIDLELVAQLHEAVAVPLVLHGSSGVPDSVLASAVGAGMTKINVGTRLNVAWTEAVRRQLDTGPGPDPRPALRAARKAMADVVANLLSEIALAPHPPPR